MSTEGKPCPPDPPCEDECCEEESNSCNGTCPVDFATGAAEVSGNYLSTPHSGNFRLTWFNRWDADGTQVNYYGHTGVNWAMDAFAYMTQGANGDLVFVWSPGRKGKAVWFSQSGSTYTPKNGARQTLTRDGNTWRVTDPNGTVYEFDVISELISKQVTPGGQVTEYFQSGGLVTEKRRTVGNNVESRVFTYTNDNVSEVTLYRGTPTTPHQTAVYKAVLQYYESTVANQGNPGDLKTITTQCPQGTGWQDVETHYYRYYTSDSSVGFKEGLKYVVGPAAYAKLTDPDTASDAQIAAVAQMAFQYDQTSRRVTQTKTNGGTLSTDITYTESSNTDDFNHWKVKSVATMPGGLTKTVYANHIGRDMLVDDQKGTDRWIRYTHFNADARVDEQANPSAIDMSGTPYNDSFADLNVQLNASKGLIRITTYYGSTDTAPGYLNEKKVQQGSSGTAINLNKKEYNKRTVNGGTATEATVYPVSKRISYRSDSGNGDPVETTYSYTWHSGTVQAETITTHLPDVGASQNGGSWLTNNTSVQEFDIQGRLEKSIDARGTETTYEYDDSTGALIKMKQDAAAGGLQLETDYTVDDLGRRIKTLGPAHDVNGQSVRTVSWTVFIDEDHETRNAQGYLVGTTNYTLVNPVTITQMGESGRAIDEVQAVRGSGVESSGELTAADTFPQTSWTRWTHHNYGDDGRLQSTQIYHNIPTSGPGSVGTNFDQTNYQYDSLGQRNYVKSPGGTITRTVFDVRRLVLSTWVGTDDAGATDTDPTGGGATGNDMKSVTENTYDTNAYGSGDNSLDGLLTKVTSPVDDSSANDRETEYRYDWRNRQTTTITTDGTNTFHAINTLDNLGRTAKTEQERTGTTDTLIAKSETFYDNRGQVYQSLRYAVSDAGVAGNSLTDATWYDEVGNVLKSLPAGSNLFTKNVYDAIGRTTESYSAYYNGGGTDNPLDLTDNVVFEQTETTYDDASNVTETGVLARYHDVSSSSTGSLVAGSTARPAYTALYFDGIGRGTAVAVYGNQGADWQAFSRPSTAPSSSNSILVSETSYHPAGEIEDSTDPAGLITRNTYDDAGRITKTVTNPGNTPTEQVDTTYAANGQIKTLKATNSTTGDQTTTYTYGVTSPDSKIASNDLLASVTYPDNGLEVYEYNRQGQHIKFTDQNDSVHDYSFDDLGRQTEDKVTLASGSDVSNSVLRISMSYDNRQRLEHITSHDAASGGTVVNDVEYEYNDFDQLEAEYQQHSGATTASSPKVQYGYDDASSGSNTIRPESVTYPDASVLSYEYGTGENNKLSRAEKLNWKSADVVEYSYIGTQQVVIQEYPEPTTAVEYTLATGAANSYAGMDRFGRIVDLQWKQSSTELVRIKYGYDRASSRTYRRDEVARAQTPLKKFDELFGYDAVHRLDDFDRGELNSGNTALVGSPTITQGWTLDQTGNWSNFNQTVQNALTQTRTHNTVNEITAISETVGLPWADPAHDANGNMTTIPQPGALDDSYTATWDAWNRLVSLTNDADSNKKVAEYEYDGMNRRTVRKAYDSAGTLDETRNSYFNGQWQVIEERVDSSTSADRQYVWGIRYIDDLVLRDRGSERLYALQDANWNVVAIADDGAGSVQSRFAYQPYGGSEELDPDFATYTGSDYEWVYRFTGREIDLDTGLQLNRNRYYHQQLGRWLSRDPIGYGDGLNLYAAYFVPSRMDPLGLQQWTHSVRSGPDLDCEYGYQIEILQRIRTPGGTVRGLQTWQTNDVNALVAITDGNSCQFGRASAKVLDVNDIRANSPRITITDKVGTKVENEGEGNVCFAFELTQKNLGFRTNNGVQFTAGRLPVGNAYAATDAQWATASKMSGPILSAVVSYIYYDSTCCVCTEGQKNRMKSIIQRVANESINTDCCGMAFEYLKYGDLGEWRKNCS